MVFKYFTYCCSVTQLCLTLCDPMNCSTPGLSVLRHLLKFAQVYFHCIDDAIQPSHPQMPSSSSALNLSQHQGLFWWVSCLHQMTKILEFQLQHQSFQWVFRVDFLWNSLVWYPYSPTDSQEFSPIWKHQFFDIQPSFWSNSHIHTRLLEKPQLWLDGLLFAKDISAF